MTWRRRRAPVAPREEAATASPGPESRRAGADSARARAARRVSRAHRRTRAGWSRSSRRADDRRRTRPSRSRTTSDSTTPPPPAGSGARRQSRGCSACWRPRGSRLRASAPATRPRGAALPLPRRSRRACAACSARSINGWMSATSVTDVPRALGTPLYVTPAGLPRYGRARRHDRPCGERRPGWKAWWSCRCSRGRRWRRRRTGSSTSWVWPKRLVTKRLRVVAHAQRAGLVQAPARRVGLLRRPPRPRRPTPRSTAAVACFACSHISSSFGPHWKCTRTTGMPYTSFTSGSMST